MPRSPPPIVIINPLPTVQSTEPRVYKLHTYSYISIAIAKSPFGYERFDDLIQGYAGKTGGRSWCKYFSSPRSEGTRMVQGPINTARFYLWKRKKKTGKWNSKRRDAFPWHKRGCGKKILFLRTNTAMQFSILAVARLIPLHQMKASAP